MGIVYSTGIGKVCPGCGQPASRCACARLKKEAIPLTDGVVRVSKETRDRKGRCVTVVKGLPLTGASLEDMARRFKQRFGTGGTVDRGVLEIQGDHSEQIRLELQKQGYTVA